MAPENQEKMMYWTESFEEQIIEIKKKSYTGFDLWKKVFADFPEYASMTEEQATTAGLYPAIHYRNHVASKWTAEMHGGHLAELDENYEGELRDIYDATQ